MIFGDRNLHEMLNLGEECLLLWGADGMIVDISLSTLEFFGAPSKELFHKKNDVFYPPFQPDGKPSKSTMIERVGLAFEKEGKEDTEFEWLYKNWQGMYLDCLVEMCPSEYMGQKIVCARITKRDQPVETIARSSTLTHDRMHVMLDAVPIGVWLYTDRGVAIDCNRHAVDLFEMRSKGELNRSSVESCTPAFQKNGEPTMEYFQKIFLQAARDGIWKGSFAIKTKTDRELDCELTLVRVEYGGEIAIMAALRETHEDFTHVKEMKVEQIAKQRLHAMLESSPLCTFIMDESYKVVDCNQMAVSLFEFRNKHHFMESVFEIAPKFENEDLYSGGPMVLNKIQQAFKMGYAQFEWTARTLTQKPVHVEFTVVRVKLENKNYAIVYIRDMRDHYKLKEMMDDEQQRIQAMLDSSPIICILHDSDGTILDVNQAVLDKLGLDSKQAYKDRLYDLAPEFQPDGTPSREKVLQTLKLAFEDGQTSTYWEYMLENGTRIPCDVHVKRVHLKGKDVAIMYARDLRKQNEMLSALGHREILLHTVNRAASALLAIEDVDSCEDALRQCIEMFGLCLNADRVQLWRIDMQQNGANASLKNEWVSDIGREYAQVNKNLFITFGSLPKWEQMFLNGESYNGPVASLPREEQELINSSGELKSVAIIPIFMQEQIWGLISIDDCVNERIFSNEEMDIIRSASLMMANAYHRVEHALEQQRIEIAEAKNREKSKFLARMSHEIRTPITAVIGISEIQLQKSGLSLDMKETFTRIHNSATLLLGIINDILDFTKIEAGRMGLRHDEYEVTSLINGITHLHVAYLGGKDIRFNLHVDENLPSYLIGDVIRIEQILNNLLSNAFKYTEKGSVDLQLSCIKNEETDKSIILQISITDTGVGMTEEQLAKIFDEFARFYEHGTHIASGTGLGMPIVQSLIHMLNAEIRLESAPGKGTNVVVRIPQAKSQKAEILGIKAARALQNLDTTHISSDRYKFAPEPMPYGRVLVVDDLEANTYVAKGLLEFYELDIDVCDSGYEAVNKIKQGNVYDIVLMDYMMPGQDGTETMKIMRSMGYTEPIVAFTANALIGKAEEFIKKGYDDFISKPIQAKHLNAVLTKYIRDKQSPEVLAAAKSATRTKKDNPDSVDLVKKLRLDFVKSHHKIFANIQSALEVADINTAHRLSHSLKSLAALIHEPVLSQMAKDIEDLFEKNEIPSSNQLALLEEELNRVLSCIGKTPEIRKKDFDVDKFSALFDELLPMLKSQNTASLDFVDELHKIPETAVLIRQIEEFKFNSALQTLETLRQVLNA